MAQRAQQGSGEERVTAKSRPMMNLTARMPSVVSSSTSSNPGRTSYGYQDPGKSVASDDRTGKLVQPSRPGYSKEDDGQSWSSQEWKSGAAAHDRSGKPEKTLSMVQQVRPPRRKTSQGLVSEQDEMSNLETIGWGKTFKELSVIDWWWKSHQSSTRKSIRLLRLCVVSWKGPPTCAVQRSLEGQDRMDHTWWKAMFNDISCDGKGNEEECLANAKVVSTFAKKFGIGQWSFIGPGSKKKWSSTE